jgi:predicted phage-related endonuclease
MGTIEIIAMIESLKEWEAIVEEATAEMEAIKDRIKLEMTNRNVETLEAGRYIARFTTVLSNRFDSTAFKKVMPDVYKAYTKSVVSRRFSIS